ncbi:MAG: 2-hydroxychromene-2-carboxylate isomerase [Amylibacter sp.]
MPYIEYFYSAHSAFAYIGAKKAMEICKANGCVLQHRPIALNPVIKAVGGLPFAGRTQAHVDYFFGREIARWAEMRDVSIIATRPTYHDNPLDLPNGMLIAAIEQGADVDTLSHAILQAHWRDDADIADASSLHRIGKSAGLDPNPLLDAALSPAIQNIHRANTDEAIKRNVFGSPTYFVDDDMFYGQDRLELVERALHKPFAG